MKTNLYILLFVLSISFQAIAQINNEKDKSEILQVLEFQRKAWNEGNIEEYMLGYWHSDSLRFVGKNGITTGWESTLKRYKKGYPDKLSMGKLTFNVLSLEILNKDTAFMIGKWEIEQKSEEISGHFTLLWKKLDNKWLIVTDHSS